MKLMEETNCSDTREENPSRQSSCVSQKLQPYLYLKISLTIVEKNAGELDDNQYKFFILQALKETLGQVGAATHVDLLSLNKGIGLVRIPSVNYEKVWAALTLYGTTPSGKRCAFRVMKASPFLMGMALDSRNHWDMPRS